jgi:hypothetical protein
MGRLVEEVPGEYFVIETANGKRVRIKDRDVESVKR